MNPPTIRDSHDDQLAVTVRALALSLDALRALILQVSELELALAHERDRREDERARWLTPGVN
jgi:hypothetical protein